MLNEDEEEISISDSDDEIIETSTVEEDMPQQYEMRSFKRGKEMSDDEYDNEEEDILNELSEVDEKGDFIDVENNESDL